MIAFLHALLRSTIQHSLEAFLLDCSSGGGLSLSMSIPALIPAETIEAAAEQCRQHAFERWKPSEGWHGHHADIMPVTKDFYDKAFDMYHRGLIDLTPEGFEEGCSFTFDSNL